MPTRASRRREGKGSKKRSAQSKQPGRAAKRQKKDYRAEEPVEDVEDQGDGDEELFKVEKIVGRKIDKNGVPLYKTRWKGYTASDDTWEPSINVASTGHVDRFERQERQKMLKPTNFGVAVIEYEDGEREMVDLKMEKFRGYQDSSDDDNDRDDDTVEGDEDVNNFGLVVKGSWVEILWPHTSIYFPCKIMSWTPLEVKKSKRKRRKRVLADDGDSSVSASVQSKQKETKLRSNKEVKDSKRKKKQVLEDDDDSSVLLSVQSKRKENKPSSKNEVKKSKKKKHRRQILEDDEDSPVPTSVQTKQKGSKSSPKKQSTKGNDATSKTQPGLTAPVNSPEPELELEPTQEMFWGDKSESVHRLRVHMASQHALDEQSLDSDSSVDTFDKPVERVGHGIPLFDEPEDDFDSSSSDDEESSDGEEEGMDRSNNLIERRKMSFEEMWMEKLQQTQELIDRGVCNGGNGLY